MINLLL